MMTSVIDNIREKNAEFLRDCEYLKETSIDDVIDELTERAESAYETETLEELTEANEMLNKLSGEENINESAAEIEKLLSADTDITFEEMIGIE